MSYDPLARRPTPLASRLLRSIAERGPMPVSDYMRLCLSDPEHGYYRRATAIGRDGDFVTAPEISQVFGELLGLWAAVVWTGMGRPEPFDLVEFGPGRGTLMADALRAASKVPGFRTAIRVHLVEVSPVLRAAQQQTLAGSHADISWHETADDIADGGAPCAMLGNEFLDVAPVDQYVRTDAGWARRSVGVDGEGRLAFVAGDTVTPPDEAGAVGNGQAGDVREVGDYGPLLAPMARRAARSPTACLLIDYGHEGHAVGDTLQAVRAHRHEHPLTSPGEADLTAQVDFSQVSSLARRAGFAVDGPVTQARFLGMLGVSERASRLMSANPGRAGEIETGIARLMAPMGMGGRFKVLGLRRGYGDLLPGLAPAPDAR
jgi:SAM-dependent MidA family methyltransferase